MDFRENTQQLTADDTYSVKTFFSAFKPWNNYTIKNK